MERVFTQDVLAANGDVKFAAGERRDWPQATWLQVAEGLKGLELDDFTSTPDALARNLSSSGKKRKKMLMKSDGGAKKSKKKKGKKLRRKTLMH